MANVQSGYVAKSLTKRQRFIGQYVNKQSHISIMNLIVTVNQTFESEHCFDLSFSYLVQQLFLFVPLLFLSSVVPGTMTWLVP